MASARAIFQAHVDDLLLESVLVELQWSFVTARGDVTTINLAGGDNTISTPAGTQLVAIKPPTTNSQALKAKGAGADTGWTLQPNIPAIFTWSAGTLIINAAGPVTGVLVAVI